MGNKKPYGMMVFIIFEDPKETERIKDSPFPALNGMKKPMDVWTVSLDADIDVLHAMAPHIGKSVRDAIEDLASTIQIRALKPRSEPNA